MITAKVIYQILVLAFVSLNMFMISCGSGSESDDLSQAGAVNDVLSALYGNYDVQMTGRVGGPYQPSNSIVSGTTSGVVSFSKAGSVTLSQSEPGVINVPEGARIAGIEPEDIIYGAAVIQNPLRVFIGTLTANESGDHGIHSMMRFGIPEIDLVPIDVRCTGTSAFSCSPEFYRRASNITGSVNLVYFLTEASGNSNTVTIHGELLDRHIDEAAAANLFTVPIESPVLGSTNDSFIFSTSTTFDITVSGNRITGNIKAQGVSAAGLVPQTAIFEANFDGTKQ